MFIYFRSLIITGNIFTLVNYYLKLKEEEIEICRGYKYLGIHITEDGRDSLEIRIRIAQGRKTIGRQNGIWWSETSILNINIYQGRTVESIWAIALTPVLRNSKILPVKQHFSAIKYHHKHL